MTDIHIVNFNLK